MCVFYLVCYNLFEERMAVRYAGQIIACSRTVLKSSMCNTSKKCQAYLFSKICLMAGIWGNYLYYTFTLGDKTFCLCAVEERGTKYIMDCQVAQWMLPSLCCVRHMAFCLSFISLNSYSFSFKCFSNLIDVSVYACMKGKYKIQLLLECAIYCTRLEIHYKCSHFLCVFYWETKCL